MSAPVLKFDCIGLELKFVILCLVVKCELQGTSISNCRKDGLWILGILPYCANILNTGI